MRVRIKTLLLVGILWLVFLTLSYSHAIDSQLNFLIAATFFTILIFGCLRHLNLYIQSLNDKLNKHNLDNSVVFNHPDPTDEALPRIQFNESLNKAIAHAKRHNKFLAILAISVDSFDAIKLKLGDTGCKTALEEISKRFKSTLRTEDLLTKLEGETFIVLLNDIGKPKYASAVAEKILRACSLPLNIGSEIVKFTASIGISIFPSDGATLESLLENVNTALDTVKQSGGNNYQFHTKETNVEAREYIELGNALQNALKNNELTLYFQPRHHLKRGCISGVEALIRWNHPTYGNVNPATFLALAEETNLILPIGEWALYEACKINKYWQDEGYPHITVGVNLSAKEFNHPETANIIKKVLSDTGLGPDYLEIEISESAVMSNIENNKKILDNIKATGVQISIDHFGVGYTSISHLKQLPINVIKIDQSFIKGIPHIPNDIAVANSFIDLAHNFGFEVVAEGVESAEQVQFLLTQHCDMVQGYYFSHPLPADKIIQQFKKILDEVLI